MQENPQPKIEKSVFTIGAGQLGLMLSKAAKCLGIPFEYASISESWRWLESLPNPEHFLVTFEQEHVEEALLIAIEKKGVESFPSFRAFSCLRNKLEQKNFLRSNGFPTADFAAATSAHDPFWQKYPAVLKAGRGGYDGQGVWHIDASGRARGQTQTESLSELLPKLSSPYWEEKISFDQEIASVVCRSKTGAMVSYPTVKTVQRFGVCVEVEFSCDFADTPLAKQAQELTKTIAEKLDYVGVLAIELFAKGDQLFINEMAPRVHNSGHFTIDVCAGSQFENHLLAGLGWPLASTAPTHPAALMVNLLWPRTEKDFASLYTRLTCGTPWPENAKLHWYGKSEVRPLRKMGHFTVYGNSLAECRAQAQQILASRWAEL